MRTGEDGAWVAELREEGDYFPVSLTGMMQTGRLLDETEAARRLRER